MTERITFQDLHDHVLKSKIPNPEFWARGILDVAEPGKYINFIEKGTSIYEAEAHAFSFIGYDDQGLKALTIPADFEGTSEELATTITDLFISIVQDLYPSLSDSKALQALDAIAKKAYELAKADDIKILAGLVLVKLRGEERRRIHLFYPSIFDSMGPVGPTLAVHFLMKSAERHQMMN